MGAFEYEDDGLKQIHTSNGRVRYDVNTNDYHYDYFLKDHLGNTRVVFTGDSNDDEPTVLQVNNYYPFGMRFNQGPEYQSQENQYLYNGKELQSDMGLDWYDYGARFYDPALGRWHVIDPIAEIYNDLSPYNYSFNNPVRFIDIDGMGPDDPVKGGKETDVKLVAYCLKQGLQLASMAIGQYSSLFGAAGDAIGVTEGQLLPNPDYASMDLTIAEKSLEISLSNGDFEDFTEVITDVNNTLEEYNLNMIDSYLLSDEQLDQLANGDITLDDLTDSKVDADDLTSEMDMEGNEDKTNVLFNRPDEEGFTENQFLVSGTIAQFKKGESDKKEEETEQ